MVKNLLTNVFNPYKIKALDFEIIFFDDCSTDNSLKIIKKYKNVKIIENKNHSSVGAFNQINAYKEAF